MNDARHADFRHEVRTFLERERATGGFIPDVDTWLQGFDRAFSRRLGERGWLGMTWPTKYGGADAPASKRFVLIEELLHAGAPVAAHWMAERQTGPQLIRFGTERQREFILPEIARGNLVVAIALSEPDSGSDLASIRARAVRTATGWTLHGQKVWTSNAHRADYLSVLVRSEPGSKRHAGLSQFLVPITAPGLTIRPIQTTLGDDPHFCEVFLDGVPVTDHDLIGQPGDGWRQVMAELSSERSGPDRIYSVQRLFDTWLDASSERDPSSESIATAGSLIARTWALRELSQRDAAVPGPRQAVAAAVLKDRGTQHEQDMVRRLDRLISSNPTSTALEIELVARSRAAAPTFTLRGGTTEVLRNIVAKNLRHNEGVK